MIRNLLCPARRTKCVNPPPRGSSHTLAVTPDAQSASQNRVLAAFAVYLRVEKGLAPLTVSSYAGDLKLWAEFLAARQKTVLTAQREDLQELLQHLLGHGMDSRSIARKLSALRQFYRYLLLDKLIAHDPTLDIDSPKQWKVLPKALSEEEVAALVESPSQRDGASPGLRLTSRSTQ